MKIPRTLKLPRKLKKELKKGFNRNIRTFSPHLSQNPIACSVYSYTTYSGSNTKSFRRLCKYVRKEETKYFKSIQEEMTKQMERNLEFARVIEWDSPVYPVTDFKLLSCHD